MPLVVAALSALSGAVMAVLPVVVIGFVTLFYNSAGGVLIFLGNLVGLWPIPFSAAGGGSALPTFQRLDTHAVAVVLWSAVATILCSVALLVVLTSMRGSPAREGNRRPWLLVGACCLLAAVAGGHMVALAVLPAIASSAAYLVRHRMRSGS